MIQYDVLLNFEDYLENNNLQYPIFLCHQIPFYTISIHILLCNYFLSHNYKMSDFMNTLFGPLNGEYCLYFYYLSILSFFLLAMAIIGGLVTGLQKGKGLYFYISILGASVAYFISYFVNRLMYSVCTKAL